MIDAGVVVSNEIIHGSDMVIEVLYSESKNVDDFSRVYFISSEGISRHVDVANLHDCLNGKLMFDRDAFFFRGERAVQEANRLMNAHNIDTSFVHRIKDRIIEWSPRKKDEMERNCLEKERTIKIVREALSEPWDNLIFGKCETYIRDSPKIGRNEACPCGSKKKHKKCCLRKERIDGKNNK